MTTDTQNMDRASGFAVEDRTGRGLLSKTHVVDAAGGAHHLQLPLRIRSRDCHPLREPYCEARQLGLIASIKNRVTLLAGPPPTTRATVVERRDGLRVADCKLARLHGDTSETANT